MAFDNLTDREKLILANLIDFYISTADPVGSRAIANKFKMGISPATIRNTMADLEELGLIQQPHTSAGRIPTDLGYRVYVDYLIRTQDLTQVEKDRIRATMLQEGRGVHEILGQTCRVLSDITQQLGVSMAPKFEEGILRRLELIPISDERIMAVVVVKSGLARSVSIEIEARIDEKELRQVEMVLNERLVGLTLGHIRETVTSRLADVSGSGRLLNLIVDSKDGIWTENRSDDIQVSGADNLVLQPEFSSLENISGLMKIIQDGRVLSEFLSTADKEGLVITIGRESQFHEIMKCSLVSSSYRVGNISGAIGVLGPTRMEYSKLASVVEYAARTITEVLSGMDKKKDAEN